MVAAPSLPSYHSMFWPTLVAIKEMGGSGTTHEINEQVIEHEGYTEAQQSVLHNGGPGSKLEYRIAWARSYLKAVGALENSVRGVWSITEAGRGMSEDELRSLVASYLKTARDARNAKKDRATYDDDSTEADDDEDWKERLLTVLLEMPPDRFEHLSRRLLREAGFVHTTVTGKSGDGGIDGIGVYRISLLSFPVFFQCKRYRGSVSSSAVRDFRGAMSGRGDKGLLITTGTFTADAKQEATREGAPPIDLIDGEHLCLRLKEYGLGVQTIQRMVEDISIDAQFFQEI